MAVLPAPNITPITTAMVLAAGKGTRLRPLTDTTPKPLVNVGGKPVLFRTLDTLAAAGIQRVVINLHYMAPMIEKAVKAYLKTKEHVEGGYLREVHLSVEDDLLETGGGIKKALPLLGDSPFLVVNSDAVWNEDPITGGKPLLKPLMAAFDAKRHDALLTVVPQNRAERRVDHGDFVYNPLTNVLVRSENLAERNVMYAGVHVTTPALVMAEAAEAFSLNKVWDIALAKGRLHGWVYDAHWVEMDTLEGLERLRGMFAPDMGAPGWH